MGLIEFLGGLVVVLLFAYLIFYLLGLMSAQVPQPIRVVITVLIVIILIVLLLNYFPLPPGRIFH